MKTIADNKTLKNRALTHLSSNWGKAAIMTLLVYIVIGVPVVVADTAIYEGLSNFITILLLPLTFGYAAAILYLKRTDTVDYNNLWSGFKDYFPVLLTELLKNIYILLWSLLLIVPGIMKAFSYAMTEFVMADDPTMRYDKAIEKSMSLMKGHKMQLFLLDLSMIGWALLCILTLGIGCLFLIPYNQTAHAEFYEELLKLNGEERDETVVDKFANL